MDTGIGVGVQFHSGRAGTQAGGAGVRVAVGAMIVGEREGLTVDVMTAAEGVGVTISAIVDKASGVADG